MCNPPQTTPTHFHHSTFARLSIKLIFFFCFWKIELLSVWLFVPRFKGPWIIVVVNHCFSFKNVWLFRLLVNLENKFIDFDFVQITNNRQTYRQENKSEQNARTIDKKVKKMAACRCFRYVRWLYESSTCLQKVTLDFKCYQKLPQFILVSFSTCSSLAFSFVAPFSTTFSTLLSAVKLLSENSSYICNSIIFKHYSMLMQ